MPCFSKLRIAIVMGVIVSLLSACASPSERVLQEGQREALADPVLLSFATVGDSRQDPIAPDPSSLQGGTLNGQDAHWLQNSPAFARILREIGAQKPPLLFFNGDMIHGYGNAGPLSHTDVDSVLASGLVQHHVQYAFWRGMVAPLMAAGTYVLPVPGNHETQCKSSATTLCLNAQGQDLREQRGGKNSIAANEDAWRANMGDLIVDAARLDAALPSGLRASHIDREDHAAMDQLSSTQRQLSYSFDVGPVHFAIVHTDPVGADSTAPTVWLSQDLAAARARGAQNLFVFGHKPAFSHDHVDNHGHPAGLDILPAQRDAFWDVIERHRATYFCGHQHVFNMRQPTLPNGRLSPAWQVIVGSGGSPFDVSAHSQAAQPFDRFYAWAWVKVHQSGRVRIDIHGFSDRFGPTQVLQSVTLDP